MIWLLVPAAIGATALIAKALKDEAEYQYCRWESKHQEVYSEIKSHNRSIKERAENAARFQQFYLLISLHHEAVKLANQSYTLFADSKISIDALNRALFKSKQEKKRIINEGKNTSDKKSRKALNAELSSLNILRKKLFTERDELLQQQRNFLEQVKELNSKTRELKLRIRDSCGLKGQEWFRKLETKKKSEKVKTSPSKQL